MVCISLDNLPDLAIKEILLDSVKTCLRQLVTPSLWKLIFILDPALLEIVTIKCIQPFFLLSSVV
jgi:hypothetical protein